MSARDEEIDRLTARIAVLERDLDSSRRASDGASLVRDALAQQLRNSEAQLRQSQEIAHVGTWDWDLRTGVVTRSPELCRIFGRSHEELGRGRMPAVDHVHVDDRERVQAELDSAVAARQSYAVDFRVVRPDGVAFIHSRGLVLCDDSGAPTHVSGTAQDVTDRKRVEARLLIADRMSSVGTLAAGMAHEINNPLAYVLSNLGLVAEELGAMAGAAPSERLREVLEMIGEARQGGERIQKIVRGLKAFSRADEERRVLVDVRRILDVAIHMSFNEIRHRAQLVKDYGEVPPLHADEGQLAQVFVNLLVNAAQAIPEGHAETNEIRVAATTDESGRVVLSFRDTGAGIAPELLGRIFDPFFTTKRVGVGTGLGLSICHGIITALGGEISVESQPGKGTVVRITLPPAPVEEVKPEEPRAVVASVAKRGRVLVVDDDARVGTTLGRVLKDHDVTVLTDARDARDRITAGERYDLILCDLMMPLMNGMDFHAELARSIPEQAARMIFVTGGAFTLGATDFLHEVPNERLEKPFDATSVRALVQRYLR
jgi:PAS domain S-box-containing protein